MAVYRLFKNKAFEPEAITMMSSAYADVCRKLGVSDDNPSEADVVAKKVIEFAQRGERDPARLRESVFRALRSEMAFHARTGRDRANQQRQQQPS
jgi:hypothetical protein